MKPRHPYARIATLILSSLTTSAFATSATWVPTTGGTWSDPTNWSTNPTIPNGIDDAATFTTGGSGAKTITFDQAITLGALTFTNESSDHYNFSAATGGQLIFSSSTGPATLTANGCATTTFSANAILSSDLLITGGLSFTGQFSGAGNLTLNSGSVALNGLNAAWTPSSITLNSGASLSSNSDIHAFGNPTSGNIVVNSGASLVLVSANLSDPTLHFAKALTLSGNGSTGVVAALLYNSSTSATVYSPITLAGGAAIGVTSSIATLNLGDPAGIITTASLSGSGPLTKNGSGTVQISVPATYSGGTNITGGTLVISPLGSLVGTGNVTVGSTSKLVLSTPAGTSISNNSLILSGNLSVIADISLANLFNATSSGGNLLIDTGSTTFTADGTGIINLSTFTTAPRLGASTGVSSTIDASVSLTPDTSHTLRFGAGSGTLTVNSVIADVAGNATKLDFTGNSTTILAGNNTYTGATSIAANAIVTVTAANGLGSTTGNTTVSGGTLNLNAPSPEPILISGGSLNINSNTTGLITISSSGLVTVNNPSASAFTLTGGTLNLKAATSGNISITGATVNLSAAGTSPITLTSGSLSISGPTSQNIAMAAGTTDVRAAFSGCITATAGNITVNTGGSLSPNSVVLKGATLTLAVDLDPAGVFSAASTAGNITFNNSSTPFTAGGTNVIDFSTLPIGNVLHLGASANPSTIAPTVQLIPDNTTHTLRFGAGSQNLTYNGSITDFNAIPTAVDVTGNSLTILGGASTYNGPTTVNGSLQVASAGALGAGTDSAVDGTIVNTGGNLTTAIGISIPATERIYASGGFLNVTTAGPVSVSGLSRLAGTFNGDISGSVSIQIYSNATFNAVNDYTGSTVINSGGNLTLGPGATLGTTGSASSTTVFSGGQLNLLGSTAENILVNGGILYANNSTSGSLATSGNGVIYLNAAGTSTITTNTGSIFINTPTSQTITMNGANVTVAAAYTGNMSGIALVTLSPGGSFAAYSLTLQNGTLVFDTDADPASILSSTSNSITLAIQTSSPFTAGGTNVLDFSSLPNGKTYNLGAASGNIVLASTISLIPDSTTHTLHFSSSSSNAGTLNINPVIADINGNATSIAFTGPGTFNLSGNNTYSGNTTVAATTPIVNVNNINGLGSTAGITSISAGNMNINAPVPETFSLSGGTLTINANTTGPISVSGGNLFITAFSSSPITMTAGNVSLAADIATPIIATGGTLNITGNLSENFNLSSPNLITNLNAAGTSAFSISAGTLGINTPTAQSIAITGGNVSIFATYSGNLTVPTGGDVTLATNGALLPGSITLTGGTLSFSVNKSLAGYLSNNSTSGVIAIATGTTFTAGGTNVIDFNQFPTAANIQLGAYGANATIGSSVNLIPDSTTHTLRFGGSQTFGLTYSGSIFDVSGIPTNLSVAGLLTLGGLNAYTGLTTVTGTLKISSTSALGSGAPGDANATIVEPGGNLALVGNITLANEEIIANGGTLNFNTLGPVHVTAPSTLNGNYSGVISGPADILVTANTTFSNDNTYTGNTTFAGGNSTVSFSGNLGSASAPTFITGNSTVLNVNNITAEPFVVSGGTLNLNAYQTGPISVSGGKLNVNTVINSAVTLTGGQTIVAASASLGSVTVGAGAYLQLNAVTSTPITVTGGELFINTPTGTFSNILSFPGGGSIHGNASVSFNQPITFAGNVTFGDSTLSLIFTNGFSGSGNVFVGTSGDSIGNLTITGPFTTTANFHATTGNVSITSSNTVAARMFIDGANTTFSMSNQFLQTIFVSAGCVTFAAPQTFSNGIIITGGCTTFQGTNTYGTPVIVTGGGTLTFAADNTISLPYLWGTLTISASKTLTLTDPTLNFYQGSLNLSGTLLGISTIIKSTPGFAQIQGNYAGNIIVQQGAFEVRGSPAGTALSVTSPADATLVVSGTIGADITLNNASGFTNGGGLVFAPVAPTTFNGNIALGNQGSTIATSNAGFAYAPFIYGNITGGSLDLYIDPAAPLGIMVPESYTGQTIVDTGCLTLGETGALSSTTSIMIQNGGTLFLDDSSRNLATRFPSSAPFTGRGGNVILNSFTTNSVLSVANFASFEAQRGLNSIQPISNGGNATININNLTREPGALVQFVVQYNGPSTKTFINLSPTPALHNGIIGGWAVVASSLGTGSSSLDFASYSSPNMNTTGVVSLALTGGEAHDINTALPTDNVHLINNPLFSSSLTSDKTINSLNYDNSPYYLTLNGHTLTIDTGGILIADQYGAIVGGNLAGGDFSNGELIIIGGGNYAGNITANFVDSPNHPTSLTFAGTALYLSGNNTYTGDTYLDAGTLYLSTRSAVSSGNVNISSGTYALQFSAPSNNPVILGNVHFFGPNAVMKYGSTYINAASWTFDSGQLAIGGIVGSGPMTFNGNFAISCDLSLYSGNITINPGGEFYYTGANPSLGQGTTTVLPGGRLELYVFGNQTLTGNVVLAGGTFEQRNGSTTPNSIFTGNLSVTVSSNITGGFITTPVTLAPSVQLTAVSFNDLKAGAADNLPIDSPNRSSIVVPVVSTLLTSHLSIGSLTVAGTVQFLPTSTASDLSSLSLAGSAGAWTGALDLSSDKLIIEPASDRLNALATLRDQIAYGSSHTAGVYSSSHPAGTSLTVVDNAIAGITNFGGIPVDADSILITSTFPGDSNLDGVVDLIDLQALATHWQQPVSDWSQADFDGNGVVDLSDLQAIATHWQLGVSGSGSGSSFSDALALIPTFSPNSSSTPEPASLCLLAASATLLVRRCKSPKK